MGTTTARAVVAVVVVVLAGCSGLSPDATPERTPDAGEGPTTTESRMNYSTPTPLQNVSGVAVAESALEASDAAETYAVNGSVSRTLQLPSGTVESRVNTSGRINRSARALYVTETTTGHAQYFETQTYAENGTVYYRFVDYENDGNVTRRSESITAGQFRLLDPLARQTMLLENASVTVVNRTTIRGQPVYEMYADVNESAYTDMYNRVLWGQQMNVTEIRFRYYTHRETGRILAMRGLLHGTASQGNGTASLIEEYKLSFEDYGADVTVEVPANATKAANG